MTAWANFTCIILSIVILIIILLTFLTTRQNSKKDKFNVIYPFSGRVNKDGKVSLETSNNTPQIDCSATGGNINIIGAFYDIVDPHGECNSNSSDVLNRSCGIARGNNVSCSSQKDCGPGLKCNYGLCSPGLAKLKEDDVSKGIIDTDISECGGNYCPIQPGTACKTNLDCKNPNGEIMTCKKDTNTCEVNPGRTCFGVNLDYNTCASFPLCSNTGVDSRNTPKLERVANKYCSPNNYATDCMPRDSSAYLARKCDGKESCDIHWNVYDIDGGFGPNPCNLDTNTSRLPIIPDRAGKYNQGYYVHGIYTCVPK